MKFSLHNIAMPLYEAQQQQASQERNIILIDGDHVELLTRAELDAKTKALAARAAPPPIPELRLADIWRDVDMPRQDRAARRKHNRKHNRTK